MKISKEGPPNVGQLACIINSIIEVLELKTYKLTSASLGEINNVLLQIDTNYKSTFKLLEQWQQVFELIEKIEQNVKFKILEMAETKFNYLENNKTLT